jgi:hypothetical protein
MTPTPDRARLEQALTDEVLAAAYHARYRGQQPNAVDSLAAMRAVLVAALLAAPPQPSPEPPEDNGKCEGCERPFTDDDLRVWTSDDVCLCDPCYRELVKASSPEPPRSEHDCPRLKQQAQAIEAICRAAGAPAMPRDSAVQWLALRHRAAPPPETTTDRRRSMQMVKRLDTDIPRRNCADLWTEADKAIHDAMAAVERAGAHPLLTYAVVLLGEAREKVADFVELPAPPAGVPWAQE